MDSVTTKSIRQKNCPVRHQYDIYSITTWIMMVNDEETRFISLE